MDRADFAQAQVLGTPEHRSVTSIADALYEHLGSADATARILEANQPGRSSADVQSVFLEYAHRLGFSDESKGLFSEYLTSALRPDYYRPLGESGILLEVERGKTTINNMDLLDFWKCHICRHAHYLVLLVPTELRQNPTMAPRKEFAAVRNRLSSFFDEPNYTNVRGLFLFGY